MELKPGDIVLVRSTSFFGWLIRLATRLPGESRSKINHTGVMVDSENLVEAFQRTVMHSIHEKYGGGSKANIAIYRWKGLSDDERAQVAGRAEDYIGASYGWFKILAHGLDRLLLGRYVFRRLTDDDRYPICSWVVASAYASVGKDFGVPAGAADPDDIWDYCAELASNEQFEEVFALGKLD